MSMKSKSILEMFGKSMKFINSIITADKNNTIDFSRDEILTRALNFFCNSVLGTPN